jgi:hypothetical protein
MKPRHAPLAALVTAVVGLATPAAALAQAYRNPLGWYLNNYPAARYSLAVQAMPADYFRYAGMNDFSLTVTAAFFPPAASELARRAQVQFLRSQWEEAHVVQAVRAQLYQQQYQAARQQMLQ